MKVNSINNVGFKSLKGLSNPDNRTIYRDLSNKYGEEFVKMSNNVFEYIDNISGDDDVFIGFRTTKSEGVQQEIGEKIDIVIFDKNDSEIASSLIDFTNSRFTLFSINV